MAETKAPVETIKILADLVKWVAGIAIAEGALIASAASKGSLDTKSLTLTMIGMCLSFGLLISALTMFTCVSVMQEAEDGKDVAKSILRLNLTALFLCILVFGPAGYVYQIVTGQSKSMLIQQSPTRFQPLDSGAATNK